jgi:hypothetical protein
MSADDNPRFVVTSLAAPTPQMLYEDLYGTRGNCENAIKAVKNDLHSDRTSATGFLANAMRLLPGVCRLCPASCLTDAHAAAYRLGPGTTLDGHPHALQNRHTDQTVQGQDSPPPAQFLSCQSPFTSGDDSALRRPWACLLHDMNQATRCPGPMELAAQPLDLSRKGRSGWLPSPLKGRGARMCGRRALLPSVRSPSNGLYRAHNPVCTLVRARNTHSECAVRLFMKYPG